MRGVTDTNTTVSGLLWQGSPRQVFEAARSGRITLFTSPVLLAELEDVLNRPKFALRLARAGVTARSLVLGYASLAFPVEPAAIPPAVRDDPDDDAVLAAAVAARAEVVITGDHHLLGLRQYQGIAVVTAAELLTRLSVDQGGGTRPP
jgi:putative PIN family toxin of toxin-antitoxin system